MLLILTKNNLHIRSDLNSFKKKNKNIQMYELHKQFWNIILQKVFF